MLPHRKVTLPMIAKSHGFSLVEILVAIAALSTLVAIGVATITRVPDDARKKKLEQDVAVVNNAIDAFLLAGGSAGQLSQASVISALKQRIGPSSGPADIVGPQGPFLDPTVFTAPTDFDWSAKFSTSPSPHFYVEQSGSGVVFTHGPAVAVGGVAERNDAARTEWVWAYANATPPSPSDTFVPTAVDGTTGWTNVAQVAVALDPPVIVPGSLSTNLWGFPLAVTISNPNPQGSSRVYYKANNGNYTLYDDTPFEVGPETSLTAVAVTLDPSRYYNSGTTTEEYQVMPFNLGITISAPASITYAQAGGMMEGQAQQSPATATINLENIQQIPPPYLSSGNFTVRYTMDGSDPVSSGTAITGPVFQGYYPPIAIPLGLDTWGTNASLQIRAVAAASNTAWFVSSDVAEATVTAARQTLDAPAVAPPDQIVSPSVQVSMAKPEIGPVGMKIRYTIDNTVPAWTNGVLYTTNFILSAFGANEERFVQAMTFPGSTNNFMTNWFLPSPAVARAYTGAAGFASSLPSGVLLSFAELQNNVQLRGSVIIAEQATYENITLFGNSKITGNLYLPGTPKIYKDHVAESQWDNQLWSPATDANFANYILGKQFDRDGNQVLPQTEPVSPRVVDLDGDVNPANYRVLIQDSAKVEGKVFRRAAAPPLPTVDNPGSKSNNNSKQYDSWTLNPSNPAHLSTTVDPSVNSGVALSTNAVLTLLPGNYGNVVAYDGVLRLGNPDNPDEVQYYSFESLQVSGGAGIEVVGKVVVTIKFGGSAMRIDNNGFFGNAAHPDWLQLNVYTTSAPSQYTQQVLVASGGKFYGRINAPKGLVTFQEQAIFNGSVTAYKIQMTGSAGANIVFSLPPVAE